MKNIIGGEIKEVSLEEIVAMFKGSQSRQHISDWATCSGENLPGIADTGVVVFEYLDMNSSQYGNRTAMICGPQRSYTLEEACEGRLGDVPSRFEYPVAFHRFKKEEK